VRKSPINVECKIDDLSLDALEWLDSDAQDLSWIHRNWRIWESPATEHELTYAELMERKHFMKNYGTWRHPVRKRSVDVIRFASNADAMYFKLKFL
jgi:hypothetical protein